MSHHPPGTLRDGRYVLGDPVPTRTDGVIECTDTLLDIGRVVRLFPEGSDEAMAALHEARVLARLNHPCMVRVCDEGTEAGYTWTVLEAAEAMSLEAVVGNQGPIDPTMLLRAALDVFAALEEAHTRGVTHRAIDPTHVLLEWGRGRLSGFGHAAGADDLESPELPKDGLYAAPELATHPAATGQEVDQFGFAATLFFAMTGRLPERLFQHPEHSPVWSGVPHMIRPVLRRACARRPAQRYPSLAAFREELARGMPTAMGGEAAGVSDAKRLFLQNLRYQRAVLEEELSGPGGPSRRTRKIARKLRGSGTTFGFPALTEAATEADAAEDDDLRAVAQKLLSAVERALQAPATDPTVLLVEDDPALQALVMQELRIPTLQARYTNSEAGTRELMSKHPIDVVILDLGLGEEDGVEFLAELRSTWPNTAVIAVSATDDRKLAAKVRQAGAERLLLKPLAPGALARTVLELLRRRGIEVRKELPPVFIVEDDPVQSKLLQRILQRADMDPTVFPEGLPVLSHATIPALYILDVGLPDIDGIELMQRLQKDPARGGVPILVLSAHDEAVDVVRALDLGADDYVAKPYIPAELLARVRRLIRSRT